MGRSSTHTNIHRVLQTGMRVNAAQLGAVRVEALQQLLQACVMCKRHLLPEQRAPRLGTLYIQGPGNRYGWICQVTSFLLRRGWAQAFLWSGQQVSVRVLRQGVLSRC